MVVTAFMIVFAMPSVMLASTFLIMDRLVSTQFFNPAEGGDALLWQHLFWFFGHPEVYIIFIPALGMISQIVPTFARRRCLATWRSCSRSSRRRSSAFGLWVHHMFATGLPPLGMSFFTAASIMIALPSGLQIFCWIATLATGGQVRFATPLMFVIGFFFIFVIGGLTGVMLGTATLDSQLHDTYFVVAHLHYVLIGGAVFPLFGALLLLVPEDHRPHVVRAGAASGTSGSSSSDSMPRSFRCTSWVCTACRGASTPTRRTAGWEDLNLLATLGALTIAVEHVDVSRSM